MLEQLPTQALYGNFITLLFMLLFLLWLIIRFVEEEDREAKFYRVLSASILTLGKLISVTSKKAKEDMQEHYLNLLREKKFWKCARHKSPHVSLPIKYVIS